MEFEFEMSMIGELSFFLGLQITQRPEGMFISQEKYLREMLKRFQMEDSKLVGTPMVTGCKLSVITLNCTIPTYLASGLFMPLPSQSHAE